MLAEAQLNRSGAEVSLRWVNSLGKLFMVKSLLTG
jgi:hypothetical protein